jgi:YebC/PmpR family DNA-binding regulatory protein
MAGHSKWANIQHRKGAQDAKRGKLFTKLIREITVSARGGGGDPASNPRLRAVIDKALVANLSKDTIERAIKKGTGALEGEHFEEVRYEGYGPGGVAVMVDCLTNNRNRTVSEVRHAFAKSGGNLGAGGSVAYLFSKVGLCSFPAGIDENAVIEKALEAGADDVLTHEDNSIDVVSAPERLEGVKAALQRAGLEPDSAEITLRAGVSTKLDAEDAEKMIRLLERLEDLDDVQNVYSNADISEKILEQLA